MLRLAHFVILAQTLFLMKMLSCINVHIEGNTNIGRGTKIFPFASIGTQPQDLKFKGETNSLEIGENNLIREYELLILVQREVDLRQL